MPCIGVDTLNAIANWYTFKSQKRNFIFGHTLIMSPSPMDSIISHGCSNDIQYWSTLNTNTDVTEISLSARNAVARRRKSEKENFCAVPNRFSSFSLRFVLMKASAVRFSFVSSFGRSLFVSSSLLLQCGIQLFTLPFNWRTPLFLFLLLSYNAQCNFRSL